jgi:hypothetical protein
MGRRAPTGTVDCGALFKGCKYSTAELADLFGVARSTGRVSESVLAPAWASAPPSADTCLRNPSALRDSNLLLVSQTLEHHSWLV